MRGHSDWVLFIQSLLCGIKSRCCINKMWPRAWMCVNEDCGSLNVKMWHSEEEKEGFLSISSPSHWTFLYSDAYLESSPYVLCLQWCSCSIIIYINYISFQSALELAWLKPETIGVFPLIFFDSHFEDSLWDAEGNSSDLNKLPLIRMPDVVFTHVDKQLTPISADGQQLCWWKHAWFALSTWAKVAWNKLNRNTPNWYAGAKIIWMEAWLLSQVVYCIIGLILKVCPLAKRQIHVDFWTNITGWM